MTNSDIENMGFDADPLNPPLTIGDFLAALGYRRNELDDLAARVCIALPEFEAWLGSVFKALAEAIEQFEATPAVAGYESLLGEKLGLHPLLARLYSYLCLHLGRVFQAESVEGRRASAVVRQIASLPEGSFVAISRRANLLKELYADGHGRPSIDEAVTETAFNLGRDHLDKLIERASGRDREACAELQRLCSALSAYVPDPRGMAISLQRSTHAVLKHYLAHYGRAIQYTYSDYKGKRGDYIDKATLATRAAFGSKRFSPKKANLKRRKGDESEG